MNDALSPARGIGLGLLLSATFWAWVAVAVRGLL